MYPAWALLFADDWDITAAGGDFVSTLLRRGVDLELEWVPRNANAEADRLADGDTQGFTDALRVGGDVSTIPWLVLPDLLSAGANFYEARARLSDSGAGEGSVFASPRLAGNRLRDREPW